MLEHAHSLCHHEVAGVFIKPIFLCESSAQTLRANEVKWNVNEADIFSFDQNRPLCLCTQSRPLTSNWPRQHPRFIPILKKKITNPPPPPLHPIRRPRFPQAATPTAFMLHFPNTAKCGTDWTAVPARNSSRCHRTASSLSLLVNTKRDTRLDLPTWDLSDYPTLFVIVVLNKKVSLVILRPGCPSVCTVLTVID